MGRNGQREWGLHILPLPTLLGSIVFDHVYPEEEIKTLFHEYFHATARPFIHQGACATRGALGPPGLSRVALNTWR